MNLWTYTFFLMASLLMTKSGFTQAYGIASYYDDSFHGKLTSSGELYNKNELTAAYKGVPYNTILEVTRLDNKKSVRVRVNDKGPFIKGRLIELSRAAARQLGMTDIPEIEVKVEVVDKLATTSTSPPSATPTNIEAGTIAKTTPAAYSEGAENQPKNPTTPQITKVEITPPPTETPKATVSEKTENKATPVKTATAEPVSQPKAKNLEESARLVRKGDYRTYDLYKIQILRPERQGYAVQVASITNYANVLMQVAELQDKWFKNILISVEKGDNNAPVYKILLGPLPDKETAEAYKVRLKKNKGIDGFTVDLSSINY